MFASPEPEIPAAVKTPSTTRFPETSISPEAVALRGRTPKEGLKLILISYSVSPEPVRTFISLVSIPVSSAKTVKEAADAPGLLT